MKTVLVSVLVPKGKWCSAAGKVCQFLRPTRVPYATYGDNYRYCNLGFSNLKSTSYLKKEGIHRILKPKECLNLPEVENNA